MPVNETENTVGAIQDWLNLKEAAQFLGVTISMVMALVERGALDTLGHGRFTQISKKSLDAIKTYQVQGNVAVEDSPAKYSSVAEVRPPISPEQALRAKGKTDLLKQINRLQAQRLEDQRQVGVLDTQLQILKQEVEILERERLKLLQTIGTSDPTLTRPGYHAHPQLENRLQTMASELDWLKKYYGQEGVKPPASPPGNRLDTLVNDLSNRLYWLERETLEMQRENLRLMRENLQQLQNNALAKKRWWR